MKRVDLLFPALALLPFVLSMTAANLQASSSVDELGLVPAPQHVERLSGHFAFPTTLALVDLTSEPGVPPVLSYLREQLAQHAGITCNTTTVAPSGNSAALILKTISDPDLGDEGYKLEIQPNRIHIQANKPAGLFYGVQTLFQLMPPEFLGQNGSLPSPVTVPCVRVVDKPRYGWRGLMLDVSRHFFSIEFIKKQIDLLAMHKMNRLHLHLTDDQGWRIEIKKYPRLTQISSWRREPDGHIEGGYYTQDELRELVRYAQSRFVTIVPEIEMPGHCTAALAAYPELSCTGGPFRVAIEWGIHRDVYCAGNDQVFQFLEDVLTEVMEIFPSKFIHVGGDEVPKDRWQHCPKCQARIKAEGLKDEAELQSYFIRRIEKFLNAHGRRLIGWDEILEGGLAPNAVVMSWRGTKGGIAAAQANHDVVMSPTTYCYFDYYQGNPLTEPLAIGGNLPLEKVYKFDPTPEELPPDKAKHILGGQANVWTEYIPTPQQAEYMIYPRLAAMAEDLWSPKEQHNWESFVARLQHQLRRYDALELHYARSLFAPELETAFDPTRKELTVRLAPHFPGSEVRVDLRGDGHYRKVTKPIKLRHSATLKAKAFLHGKPVSDEITVTFLAHKALGKPVTLGEEMQNNYTLTDGLFGTRFTNDGRWQRVKNADFVATVDLGKPERVGRISIRCLQNTGRYVFLPKKVEFAVSEDGENFREIASVLNPIPPEGTEEIVREFSCRMPDLKVKKVRVTAKNIGVSPLAKIKGGTDSWIFVDEIVVE